MSRYACHDGMCGADDCRTCHPENFYYNDDDIDIDDDIDDDVDDDVDDDEKGHKHVNI